MPEPRPHKTVIGRAYLFLVYAFPSSGVSCPENVPCVANGNIDNVADCVGRKGDGYSRAGTARVGRD